MSMGLDVIFAYVVGVLAGLAVIGALTFALVWEWCAIRRTLAAHRDPPPQTAFWREPYGAERPGAATMRTAGRFLLLGWLMAALAVLGIDGRLPEFLAGVASGSLLLLRQQLTPSRYNRPSMPERSRVADDLRQPLATVVAVAELNAMTEQR